MLTATKLAGKPRKTTESFVTFDATKFRNRHTPSFAAGLVPATRWTGDHRYAPWTQEEADWATRIFLEASIAEVDAEEEAYHRMLDAMALEDACVSRLARGHCL